MQHRFPLDPKQQSKPCPKGAVESYLSKDHRNQEALLHQSMVLARLLLGLHKLARASPHRAYRSLRKAIRFLAASWRLCYILHLVRNQALVRLSIYLLLSRARRLVPYRYRPRRLLPLRSLFRLRGFLVRRRRCT